MSFQSVNNGATAGDNAGENLFSAFQKVNSNFSALFARVLNAQDYYEPTDSGFDAAINRAIDAANAAGGGCVLIPNLGAVYSVTAPVILKSNVLLRGDGSTLKLANGVNTSVVQGLDYTTLTGTGSSSGISNFGIRDLIVDGNRDNNASPGSNVGHGIAFYGYSFSLRNLKVLNAPRRGLSCEFGSSNGLGIPFNGQLSGLLVHTCGEEGWYNAVSDLHAYDVNVSKPGQTTDNTYDGISLIRSIRGGGFNVWGAYPDNKHRYSLYVGSSASATTVDGMHLETAKTANVRVDGIHTYLSKVMSYNLAGTAHAQIDANHTTLQIDCFTGGVTGESTTEVGVQLGVGATRATCDIDVRMTGASAGAVDFTNSGGGNRVRIQHYLSSGGSQHVGTPHAGDDVEWLTFGSTSAEHQYARKRPVAGGALTPTGTTQAGAALITRSICRVSASSAAAGVRLNGTFGPGTDSELTNTGTTTCQVYPPVGHNFYGLSADVAVTLPVNCVWKFRWETSTSWSIEKTYASLTADAG